MAMPTQGREKGEPGPRHSGASSARHFRALRMHDGLRSESRKATDHLGCRSADDPSRTLVNEEGRASACARGDIRLAGEEALAIDGAGG